jgi:hypothetical protein
MAAFDGIRDENSGERGRLGRVEPKRGRRERSLLALDPTRSGRTENCAAQLRCMGRSAGPVKGFGARNRRYSSRDRDG